MNMSVVLMVEDDPGDARLLREMFKIVERHAGDITASGRPGEGATFTVILPLRQATPAGHAIAA